MTEKLLYQLRIYFSTVFTRIYNSGTDHEIKDLLTKLLNKHNASLLSQYDGFMGYVKEAEKYGIDNYPLYHWTKDCLKDKSKIEKYKNSYSIYIDSEAVYSKEKADILEKEIKDLIDRNYIMRISKHDTNPKNNPQPPKKYLS